MGAYSPAPFLTDAELAETGSKILAPWLRGCAEEGIDFRGILYPGVMLTRDGPKVLEFNARFGDPEAQVYLTRLESDLLDLLEACVDGTLEKTPLRWRPEAAVCVVMAAAGYPGTPAKGALIRGLAEAGALPTRRFSMPAPPGKRRDGHQRRTGAGRGRPGTPASSKPGPGPTRRWQESHSNGAQFRSDIGAKALRESFPNH